MFAEYYLFNPGAWVSLGIVFISILTSWALNYSAPKVRVFGTLLAALGSRLSALGSRLSDDGSLVLLFCHKLGGARESQTKSDAHGFGKARLIVDTVYYCLSGGSVSFTCG